MLKIKTSFVTLFLVLALVGNSFCPDAARPFLRPLPTSLLNSEALAAADLWIGRPLAGKEGFQQRHDIAWALGAHGENWRDLVPALLLEGVDESQRHQASGTDIDDVGQALYDALSQATWQHFLPKWVLE